MSEAVTGKMTTEKMGEGAKARRDRRHRRCQASLTGEELILAAMQPGEAAKKVVDATVLSPYGTNIDGNVDVAKIKDDTTENESK